MYELSDPRALRTLRQLVVAAARVSAFVQFVFRPSYIEVFSANTSDSVAVTGRLLRGFSGSLHGVFQTRARIADHFFTRIQQEENSRVTFALEKGCLRVEVFSDLYAKRVYRLAIVENELPSLLVTAPIGENRAGMRVDVLQGMLAPCLPGAEEAELKFDVRGIIVFRARREPARAQSTPAISVDTQVQVALGQLEWLRVEAPYHAVFRLREMRYMAQLFDQLDREALVHVEFGPPGRELRFALEMPLCVVEFVYSTRSGSARSGSATAMEVGTVQRRRLPMDRCGGADAPMPQPVKQDAGAPVKTPEIELRDTLGAASPAHTPAHSPLRSPTPKRLREIPPSQDARPAPGLFDT